MRGTGPPPPPGLPTRPPPPPRAPAPLRACSDLGPGCVAHPSWEGCGQLTHGSQDPRPFAKLMRVPTCHMSHPGVRCACTLLHAPHRLLRCGAVADALHTKAVEALTAAGHTVVGACAGPTARNAREITRGLLTQAGSPTPTRPPNARICSSWFDARHGAPKGEGRVVCVGGASLRRALTLPPWHPATPALAHLLPCHPPTPAVSDLYKMGFNPLNGPHNFTERAKPE